MKKFALLLTILTFTPLRAQDLPAYTCFKTNAPPTIDGMANDEVWRQAVPTDLVDVEDLTRTTYHSRPTELRLLWDEDALYVLFIATDPDVWSTYANRDDNLWEQEVVEFYADPNGDGLNYVEIEVNPLNTIVDLLMDKPWRQGGNGDFTWSPPFATAVHVEGTVNDPSDQDEYWSMEMALPWSVFDPDRLDVPGDRSLPPLPGDQWRMNFYRYERIRVDGEETEIEYNAWSPVGRIDFHVPERFGIVTFADAPTAIEAASWGIVKKQR